MFPPSNSERKQTNRGEAYSLSIVITSTFTLDNREYSRFFFHHGDKLSSVSLQFGLVHGESVCSAWKEILV